MDNSVKRELEPGVLYVVATPIGNLEDLSPRAVKILNAVDLIACEDTRHTRKLLIQYSVQTPTTSYHEHNEASKALILVEKLVGGQSLALVSDAGTPLLSDPGYRLVRHCRQNGILVSPIPGPFAGAAACSVSGLPSDEVLFVGFLPDKAKAQRRSLERLASKKATLVIYVAPHRLRQTLKRISERMGDREAYLVREMTKIYEASYWGTVATIAADLADESPRGEYTLVMRGATEQTGPGSRADDLDIAAYVTGLIHHRGLSKKEAIKAACADLGLSKREVYESTIKDSWAGSDD
jgi:16S rRNA (cytidine1402-2'-O)-methyltransferase